MTGLVSNIKQLAYESHQSIEDVGKNSGVGEKAIYRWDRVPPKITTLKKLVNILESIIDCYCHLKAKIRRE
ncbi:XRE family transcriptional regulator [Lactiplantibacillus plantarum]|uniref:XRE family transcriptional regulator n=1 Tax=Lactiplantibacillus plantarum TaxID=1590 RepID=UPI001F4D25BA|nr:XRE family transcriptional regulator [Lactiplantibacillus plantarum]MCH8625978.1 XRE family transcriptional regulator [Lactiplantibacillus plantarum]